MIVGMTYHIPSRADDELKLWMVRAMTNRIRGSDAAESGECVEGSYWR